MSATTTGRPPLVFRAGISGKRGIAPEHEERIRRRVAEVLGLIRSEVTRLAQTAEAKAAYRDAAAPLFRLLSPLAEGADRLVAREAHEQRWALSVPMPFERNEYQKDFASEASQDEFRGMLEWAGEDTVELDGGRDDAEEWRSYEAVGRYVVRNCDLLIAVWDGRPGKGRGGTADTVQFAAESGPAVWWIHATADVSPVWIEDGRDLWPGARRGDAAQALRQYIEQLLLPPVPSGKHARHRTLLEWGAKLGRRETAPLPTFYREVPLPSRPWSSAYRTLMRWAARFEPVWNEPGRPDDLVAAWWHDAYEMPNARAGEYASRYRSTYVWVFGLAALALAFAAASLGMSALDAATRGSAHATWHVLKSISTAVELAALLSILVVVGANIRQDWHQKWIDYRLLAELYRKQQALAGLGWSLSGRAVQALVAQKEDRAAWLIWLFAAMLRAAPMPRGRFDAERCNKARAMIERDLVNEQLDYHEGRQTQCERAGHCFVRVGEALFFIVVCVVVAKLVLLIFAERVDVWTALLGIAAAILPALAATFIGVRADAERELLADQSKRMRQGLELGRERIRHVKPARPLASQELGRETLEVAALMLQDVDGWARLFRVKLVEAG